MYRDTLRPLQCPTCGGTQLTPATQLTKEGTNSGLRVLFQGPDESWASTGQESFPVKRARVCLHCGYVMAFMSDPALRKLRSRIASLQPLPPADPE